MGESPFLRGDGLHVPLSLFNTPGDQVQAYNKHVPVSTPIGTAGQVWTVNDNANAAEWADATGGGGGAAISGAVPTGYVFESAPRVVLGTGTYGPLSGGHDCSSLGAIVALASGATINTLAAGIVTAAVNQTNAWAFVANATTGAILAKSTNNLTVAAANNSLDVFTFAAPYVAGSAMNVFIGVAYAYQTGTGNSPVWACSSSLTGAASASPHLNFVDISSTFTTPASIATFSVGTLTSASAGTATRTPYLLVG